MEYLVIDGYNLINAWDDVFDVLKEPLEDIRVRLLNMLSNYQGYKKINLIVVFDAHLVKGGHEKKEIFDNLEIVFTKENETADNYIERFVYRMAAAHTIRVVTSDYLEQRIVLNSGGVRMSPRELKVEMDKAGKNAAEKASSNIKKANTIMSNIDPQVLEKLEKMRRG